MIVLATAILAAALGAQSTQRVVPATQPVADESTESSGRTGGAPVQEFKRIDKGRRVHGPVPGEELPVDAITVRLPQEAAGLLDPRSRQGTAIVMLRAVESSVQGDPACGPFFADPGPVGSVAVGSLVPELAVRLDEHSVWWPECAPDCLDGTYEIQAVFSCNPSDNSHLAPGNLVSAVTTVDFRRDTQEIIDLDLTTRLPAAPLPQASNIEWIELESPRLSAALGRRVMHRAAVVFPRDYDNTRARRRVWPTVYVVPGFGAKWSVAQELSTQLADERLEALCPEAVHVVLDPDGQHGQHCFVDSVANGPRGEALVSELIPYLEGRFRLLKDPETRVVTGHSSGGWAAIWLLLTHPDAFSAAFSSAPESLDFSQFQTSNIYRDENLFVGPDGTERPAFRMVLGPSHELVPMLVRDEIGIEHAISPSGNSGEQWDAWAARLGVMDPRTDQPRRICDPLEGTIDPETVEAWARCDIARRIATQWKQGLDLWGVLFASRARVMVGSRDSFYFERSAIRLRDMIDAHARSEAVSGREFPSGPGYIEVIPGATHDSIYRIAQLRFNHEIREHLRAAGAHE